MRRARSLSRLADLDSEQLLAEVRGMTDQDLEGFLAQELAKQQGKSKQGWDSVAGVVIVAFRSAEACIISGCETATMAERKGSTECDVSAISFAVMHGP